jgi:hypothetical protein
MNAGLDEAVSKSEWLGFPGLTLPDVDDVGFLAGKYFPG